MDEDGGMGEMGGHGMSMSVSNLFSIFFGELVVLLLLNLFANCDFVIVSYRGN